MTDGKLSRRDSDTTGTVVLNHDVIRHILDFLRNHPGCADLARCARVSRAFSDPALRLLWSTLHSPLPLWLLLGPDRTGNRRHQPFGRPAGQQFELLRTIVDGQLWNDRARWARFLHYGQMVRELNFSTGELYRLNDLHAEIARAVVAHNGGRTVFPSLLVFAWPKTLSVNAHEDIARLLSPSVVQLMFSPDRADCVGSDNILPSVRNAAPFLKEITFMGTHPPAMGFVDELMWFQHLRMVEIFAALPHGNVHTLLSKLRLTELEVGIFLDTGSTIRPSENESLQKLTVHGASPDLAAIFPTWSFPALQYAKIALLDHSRVGGGGDPGLHPHDLFAAIVAPFSPTAFRNLDISVGTARLSASARDAAIPLAQFLRPAFQLRGLHSLRLTFTGRVALSSNDDVFAELAASWPSLRALLLEFRAWHADGPVPTPLVLLSLARSCPNLQRLVLPYLDHTVKLEMLPSREVLEAAAHPLRQLFIADDRSKENITPAAVEALCAFVGGLFPRLSPQFRRYLREPGKAWTAVLDRLRGGRGRRT